jgi:hypothetical protein
MGIKFFFCTGVEDTEVNISRPAALVVTKLHLLIFLTVNVESDFLSLLHHVSNWDVCSKISGWVQSV